MITCFVCLRAHAWLMTTWCLCARVSNDHVVCLCARVSNDHVVCLCAGVKMGRIPKVDKERALEEARRQEQQRDFHQRMRTAQVCLVYY